MFSLNGEMAIGRIKIKQMYQPIAAIVKGVIPNTNALKSDISVKSSVSNCINLCDAFGEPL